MLTKFPASWPPAIGSPPAAQPAVTQVPDPLLSLVAALHAHTAAIESLVAVNAALLERLGSVEEPDPPEPDEGLPQPMSRKR